jgi:mRNA interferase MazF
MIVPDRGDIIWLTMQPVKGHEQSGRRPVFVLSPKGYNKKVGLALCCPITHKIKGYPFEVKLPAESEISGVILADQLKSLDWTVRKAEYICSSTDAILKEVQRKAVTLIL